MIKRIDYIDIAKAIGIYFVILGHTVDANTYIKSVLYSFHMPLFFMISGMVIKKRTNFQLQEQIKKRAFVLLIPFFIWGTIYAKFSFVHLMQISYGSREMLVLAGSLTSLWFLPCLFLVSCFSEFIVSKYSRKQISICVLVLVVVGFFVPHLNTYGYPFGADVAIYATAFSLCGYMVKNDIDIKKKAGAIILLLAVFIVSLNANDVGYVLMAQASYGNKLLFFISAICGSFIVLMLSVLISKIDSKKWFIAIGKYTLGIFLIHKPIILMVKKIFMVLGSGWNTEVAIITSLITLIISYYIARIGYKMIPNIFGAKINV